MGHDRRPCIHKPKIIAWQVSSIKHLRSRLVTVHGLDFGIRAEMTTFLAWLDLWITMRTPLGNAVRQALLDGASDGIAKQSFKDFGSQAELRNQNKETRPNYCYENTPYPVFS